MNASLRHVLTEAQARAARLSDYQQHNTTLTFLAGMSLPLSQATCVTGQMLANKPGLVCGSTRT